MHQNVDAGLRYYHAPVVKAGSGVIESGKRSGTTKRKQMKIEHNAL